MKSHISLARLFVQISFCSFAMTTSIESKLSEGKSDVKPVYCNTNCDCKNDIDIRKICANILLANCVNSGKISAQDICASNITGSSICADSLNLNSTLCVDQIGTNTANVGTLNVNNLCVTGHLNANSANICNNDRATMIFSKNTNYILSSLIEWDVIIDNPSGGAGFTPNSHYTAQNNGYYLVTLQILSQNLQTASGSPILGTPIANVQIFVNGILYREVFLPYLTFLSSQSSSLTSLIQLNKGDVVTSAYNVLIIDPLTGLQSVNGSVDLLGNNTSENESIFKIIYLSSACPTALCNPVASCMVRPCDTTCTPCCE